MIEESMAWNSLRMTGGEHDELAFIRHFCASADVFLRLTRLLRSVAFRQNKPRHHDFV